MESHLVDSPDDSGPFYYIKNKKRLSFKGMVLLGCLIGFILIDMSLLGVITGCYLARFIDENQYKKLHNLPFIFDVCYFVVVSMIMSIYGMGLMAVLWDLGYLFPGPDGRRIERKKASFISIFKDLHRYFRRQRKAGKKLFASWFLGVLVFLFYLYLSLRMGFVLGPSNDVSQGSWGIPLLVVLVSWVVIILIIWPFIYGPIWNSFRFFKKKENS